MARNRGENTSPGQCNESVHTTLMCTVGKIQAAQNTGNPSG